MKHLLVAIAALTLLTSLGHSAPEVKRWQVLFNGESVDQWRGYKQKDFPHGGWEVKEGLLTSIAGGDRIDIITRERYTDFELELEWRVGPEGNSGVFFRVSEEPASIWNFAPECQILDDTRGSGKNIHSAGALYDLLPPTNKALNPTGEFNTLRIVSRGDKVEHWLNDRKILTYDLSSDEVKKRIAESKFAEFEQFARIHNGFIGLQHHGDAVSFRKIRIRRLDTTATD